MYKHYSQHHAADETAKAIPSCEFSSLMELDMELV